MFANILLDNVLKFTTDSNEDMAKRQAETRQIFS